MQQHSMTSFMSIQSDLSSVWLHFGTTNFILVYVAPFSLRLPSSLRWECTFSPVLTYEKVWEVLVLSCLFRTAELA